MQKKVGKFRRGKIQKSACQLEMLGKNMKVWMPSKKLISIYDTDLDEHGELS